MKKNINRRNALPEAIGFFVRWNIRQKGQSIWKSGTKKLNPFLPARNELHMATIVIPATDSSGTELPPWTSLLSPKTIYYILSFGNAVWHCIRLYHIIAAHRAAMAAANECSGRGNLFPNRPCIHYTIVLSYLEERKAIWMKIQSL